MSRVRISTTVDGDHLRRCRALLGVADSELMDRALVVLQNVLIAGREIEALEGMPYEDDPDLAWHAPSGPDLPYDGEVPAAVRALARRRRATS